jgi:tetratricopeptide (TPR) repeat protein
VSLAWALPLVIAMQTRSAVVSPRPVAWAAQSPRPAACLGAPGLWEISRQALLGRRCRELARAQALLLRAPEKARARADALLGQAPDFVAARIVRGRAALRTGDSASALADLRPFLAEDAALSLEPAALLDGGRAALAQRDVPAAIRFYRLLGNRAALLPEPNEQVVAYIEIAATLLASEGASTDEVLAFLREARRRSPGTGYTGLCAALTAVAWISGGREAEGQGALSELGDAESLEPFEKPQYVWLPDGIFHAVMGLALERARPDASAEHYQALAAGPLARLPVGKLGARQRPAVKRGAR